ncbi:DELTA-sagatoxin-Srs1a-like [Gadus macrocephalus]|uniref:DELTA-sagatoxin-Srs1a-like n=1 Tax=Gadus macrocephalus TaxID=80720 RepID=UPI0028CB81D0|nr:DELTA-sagatoxin-Srs1a-like [Gadus macrocephalus]
MEFAVFEGAEEGQGLSTVCPTHRKITIEIENATRGYCLTNHRFHLMSGGCLKTLPFDINPGTRDTATFEKTRHTAEGSIGVFTFDLSLNSSDPTKKMAVMFSVPYDFNRHSNWHAVGVFNSDEICDDDLYCKMFNDNSSCFVRGKAADGSLKYEHRDVVIHASMSDTCTPELKLKVEQV